MPLFDRPHVNHEEHLCSKVEGRKVYPSLHTRTGTVSLKGLDGEAYTGTTLEEYMKLVDDPKYLCRECGRAANKAENLCSPVKL